MATKYVVETSAGTQCSFKDRWTADNKVTELLTKAGELGVAYSITLTQRDTLADVDVPAEVLATFHIAGPQHA
jgi:hypothetical protein